MQQFFFLFCVVSNLLLASSPGQTSCFDSGTVVIRFQHLVNDRPLLLEDTVYTNPFGEDYTVTKFRYYVSHIRLMSGEQLAGEDSGYYLVDQRVPESMSLRLQLPATTYTELQFLLGVDSVRNVSGAQSGALDPLNDMFWTWNNGYVMAKMEGTSSFSPQPGHRFEYHIGGFSGPNSVLRTIRLHFPAGKELQLQKDHPSEIILTANLNKWWTITNGTSIANMQVCTTPGPLAKRMADNYCNMFTVADISNH